MSNGIVCLDLEGVLIPEIWQHVAERMSVPDLKLTTRDVKDYCELMDRRVEICSRNGIDLQKIQELISELSPLRGAREFVDKVRNKYQLIILSDTFYQFAHPLMKQLDFPTLFCHSIEYDQAAKKIKYHIRQDNSKQTAVEALKNLNFRVFAAGDSYNDIHMLKAADSACFFRAPAGIEKEFPGFKGVTEYDDLLGEIEKLLG